MLVGCERETKQQQLSLLCVGRRTLVNIMGREATEDDPLLGQEEHGHKKKKGVYHSSTKYVDHFSLESPSDEVCFRKSAVRVYGSGTQQFQLVESKGGSLKAKVVRVRVVVELRRQWIWEITSPSSCCLLKISFDEKPHSRCMLLFESSRRPMVAQV